MGGGACEEACLPVLVLVCEALKEGAALLNEFDGVCGDGDCGRVMLAAASHILQQVEEGVFAQATDRASFCFQVCVCVCPMVSWHELTGQGAFSRLIGC